MTNVAADSLHLGPAPRVWRRRLAYAMAGAAAFTGLVGILHLPFAAPLLRKISPAALCPIQRGTPDQVDRAHAIAAAGKTNAGATAAPVRFALGFELDRTTRGDVTAWGEKNAISCSQIAGNETLMRCTDVPLAALAGSSPSAVDDVRTYEEVTFAFRSTGELVNVQARRRHLSADAASKLAGSIAARTEKALGRPSTVGGEPTAAHLSRGALSTFVAQYAFSDYEASVAATNLPPYGVMVREQYISLRR